MSLKLTMELDDLFYDRFDETLSMIIKDEIVNAIRKEVKAAIKKEEKQVKSCVETAVRKAVRSSVDPALVDKMIKEQLK